MKWRGKPTSGVNPIFLGKVAAAASSAGATYIYVISGKRTPATNTGVKNSNHLSGHALDGYAYVPGRGKVPLGTLLKESAAGYGLRSGDVAGFYPQGPWPNGTDPNHVDDGYNVKGGTAPAAPTTTPETQAPTQQVDTSVDSTGQPVGADDPTLGAAISQIPQAQGPDTVNPSVSGDFTGDTAAAPAPYSDTWQMIAAQGPVSPDTLRLAQLAGYGGNAASSG